MDWTPDTQYKCRIPNAQSGVSLKDNKMENCKCYSKGGHWGASFNYKGECSRCGKPIPEVVKEFETKFSTISFAVDLLSVIFKT